MHVIFTDDSNHKGKREGMGKIISFGAVIFDANSLKQFEHDFNYICFEKYGIPEDEEIKWSPDRNSFIFNNLHDKDRENCYKDILLSAMKNGCQAVVMSVDQNRTENTYEETVNFILDCVFERISYHLSNINSNGIIIADRPGGGSKEEDQFLKQYLNRVEYGTKYSEPDRIALNVLTTSSKHVKQLQLADLVTSITTAMVSGNVKYAKPLFLYIKQMLVHSNYGQIAGAGLKLYPENLLNLYYYLLGEDYYFRYGDEVELDLPYLAYPYAKDPMKL